MHGRDSVIRHSSIGFADLLSARSGAARPLVIEVGVQCQLTDQRTRRALALLVAVTVTLCLGASRPSVAQTLATVTYELASLAVDVSPHALTVPRGVATQLNTTATGLTN